MSAGWVRSTVAADSSDRFRNDSTKPKSTGQVVRSGSAKLPWNSRFNVIHDATSDSLLIWLTNLAAMVQAGLDGIREQRDTNSGAGKALPTSLSAALTLLEQTRAARDWLGAGLLADYLSFKRAELAALSDLDEAEICRRYREAY